MQLKATEKWHIELFQYYFNLSKNDVSDLTIKNFEGFFGETINYFTFHIKSEEKFKRYLKEYYIRTDLDNKNLEQKAFFNDLKYSFSCYPEKNVQFESYIIKNRPCSGKLYFIPQEKLVYAIFSHNASDGTSKNNSNLLQ